MILRVYFFQAEQTYALSIGQEIDEYIRTQLMPSCTHENHLPVSNSGGTLARTSAEVDSLVTVSEPDFDSALAENKTKDGLHTTSEQRPATAPMRLFVNISATKKAEVDLKSDIKLIWVTPVVLPERLSVQHVVTTAQQMKPNPFSSSKALNRVSNSTSGRVTKSRGQRRKKVENNPKNVPSASMSSTPVSVILPRKRGWPRKASVTTQLTKDAMDDSSMKNEKQITPASMSYTTRPR